MRPIRPQLIEQICRVVDKVLADPIIKDIIDQCWIDGANTYIKQDEEILKRDPNFRERRFAPPKRTLLRNHVDTRSVQEDEI